MSASFRAAFRQPEQVGICAGIADSGNAPVIKENTFPIPFGNMLHECYRLENFKGPLHTILSLDGEVLKGEVAPVGKGNLGLAHLDRDVIHFGENFFLQGLMGWIREAAAFSAGKR